MRKMKKMNYTIKKTLAKICKGTHLKWDQVLPIASLRIKVASQSGLKLSPLKVYGSSPQISVLGTPPLDLEHESKTNNMYNIQSKNYQFCTSLLIGGPSIHLMNPYTCSNQDTVLLMIWMTQGPEQQLTEQWTSPHDVLLTIHSSPKLMGIKPQIPHTRIKLVLHEEENLNLAAAVDTKMESCTCPAEDLKFLFQRGTAPPKAK